MKTKLLLFIIIIGYFNCTAQFGPQQILDSELANPLMVISTDLDGDGDMDILATSDLYPIIAWYENLDGEGTFSDQQILTPNAYSVRTISAADIDGDGDVDLFATLFFNKIVWFENLDGLGTFGTENVISDNSYGATNAKGVDIDNDGDLDVVTTCIGNPIEQEDSKLSWYENIDGQGTFGSEHILQSNTDNYRRSIVGVDLDNDGDMDIIASEKNSIEWYENSNGTGNFALRPIAFLYPSSILDTVIIDMDNDGDNDILNSYSSGISWLENMDGNGNFALEHIVFENNYDIFSIYATDFDDDGDADIVSGTYDAVQWHENSGQGNFGPSQMLSNDFIYYTSVYSSDLDNDSDMDILSLSRNDSQVLWFENLTDLGLSENAENKCLVYPNPASDILFVKSDTSISNIKVYTISGQLVLSRLNLKELNISALSAGLYIVKIQDFYGNSSIEKLVKL